MKKHILIIDDEEKIRKIYKRYFYSIGSSIFDITETSNATDATNCIIRHKIDIIILDINMPYVDGGTMFEVIREYSDRIDVIIASVYPIEYQKRVVPHASEYYDKSQGIIKLLDKVLNNLTRSRTSCDSI